MTPDELVEGWIDQNGQFGLSRRSWFETPCLIHKRNLELHWCRRGRDAIRLLEGVFFSLSERLGDFDHFSHLEPLYRVLQETETKIVRSEDDG